MDAVSDKGGEKRQLALPLIAFVIALFLAIAENELNAFRLLSSEPNWVSICGGFIGFLTGGLLSDRMYRIGKLRGQKVGYGRGFALLAFPLLLIVGGDYIGERLFLAAAFVGGAAVPQGQAEAAISDNFRRRSMIRLEIDPRFKRVSVATDGHAAPSAIGRYCITLPLERGRYGAIRTRVPKLLDEAIRLDQFRPCSPQFLPKNPGLAERVARIEARAAGEAE